MPVPLLQQQRRAIGALRIVLAAVVLLSGSRVLAASPESLARLVPARVQFFLELHNLREARHTWRLNELWSGLVGLTAAPAGRRASLDEWRDRVEQALGMPTDQAIDLLLGEQMAVAAPRLGALHSGVVMARVSRPRAIATLVARLARQQHLVEDKPVSGVRRYRSRDRIRLARKDDVVAFTTGPAGTPLLEQIVRLMAETDGASLGADTSFTSEVKRLPPDLRGLIYFGRSPTEEIQVATPAGMTPIGSSLVQRGVIGLYAREGGVEAELRGLRSVPTTQPAQGTVSAETLASLPADTLVAYATTVDYPAGVRRLRAGQYTQLTIYLALLDTISGNRILDDRMIDAMGSQTVLVIGRSRKSAPEPPSFIAPMASLIIEVKDPNPVVEAINQSAMALVNLLNTPTAGTDPRNALQITCTEHGADTIRHVALDTFLKPLTRCVYLQSLELSWTVADGWLILSTHPEHITQLLDARRQPLDTESRGQAGGEEARTLRSSVARAFAGEPTSSQFIVQSALTAKVVQSWLDYLDREYPQMTEPEWWQRTLFNRDGDRVTLGVGLARIDAHPGYLRVTKVLSGWPGAGRLEVGDRIVGVNGQLLSTDDPRGDFADKIRDRDQRKQVKLRVERDHRSLDITIPLPSVTKPPVVFDPVRLLRGLTTLAHQFGAGTYATFSDESDRFNARLTLTPARRRIPRARPRTRD